MINIKMYEVLNSHRAITREQAISVRNLVDCILSNSDEIVVLDFKGIKTLSVAFIYSLIGEYIEYSGIDVMNRISYKNLSTNDRELIYLVTSNVIGVSGL